MLSMSIQLPYNPHPPGAAPIPVWVPPYNHNPPGRQHIVFPFATVTWAALGPRRAQETTHTPLATFHLFNKLPPELRVRIWTFAAPDRVLELRSWGNGAAPIKISVHPHRLPSLFRSCHESRSVARCIYRPTEIGVSFAVKDSSKTYVDWKIHPSNEASGTRLPVGRAPLNTFNLCPEPYRPQTARVSWEHDVIYFGPDFERQHLGRFFKGEGEGLELKGLKRVAISRNLWCGTERERDVLRECLWRLKKRDVSEVIIVPDDDKGPLIDRWYYGKHDIDLLDPEWIYTFRQDGGLVDAKTVVESMEEWFQRLWKLDSEAPYRDGAGKGMSKEQVLVQPSKKPPVVLVKSIRRNGRRMAAFKDGLWECQQSAGDMRAWRSWAPPERS